ncbi:MAG TPA: hypothetical protein VH165_05920 [Kofleriaceae bacterium]|nr:hypothetical protein [Kofleriaceae bacterium]
MERAIAVRDPRLGALVVRYLAQDDPEDGRSELSPTAVADDDDDDDDYDDDDDDDDDDDAGGGRGGSSDEHENEHEDDEVVDVPAGAFTLHRLNAAVSTRGLANKTATERKLARGAAFAAAEASPFAPPRLRLGKLLIDLYERGDPDGRAALLEVFAEGTMKWGVWQAAKAIYKRAEDRHDAALWGVLAFRFDAMRSTRYETSEIGPGTLLYLRRRAWRYLRLLGQAVPEAYPVFAVEVLRHYPASHDRSTASWVAAQIWNHGGLKGGRGTATFGLPSRGDPRAFPQAWKLSPAPLLRLLEAAGNELVCDWAIRSLRADHPLALRAVEPAWLARLGRRPVAAIHAFVVALLRDSPELHQSKLRELGLHDVVIGFLRSASPDARRYALEYAAAHAPDLAVDDLIALIEDGEDDVAKFAAARLEAMAPRELGVRVVLRLLGVDAAPWAARKLADGFAPADIDAALFVETAARGNDAFGPLIKFWNDKQAAIPAGHWRALLDDERFAGGWSLRKIVQTALTELGKRTADEIGAAWIQKSLEDRARTDAVARWLDAGMLSGDALDVEWLKRLVGKPRLRPIALKLLADRRRVAPARVGLGWLLELARSSDAELAQFAQRMLLESFEPGDFADGGDRAAGVARLWELATGARSAEAVRGFAATYLKAHHPDLGPRLAEARALGIKPRLAHNAYPLATVRPLLFDDRADVRRLAVAIAGEEIVRWGDQDLVYELASAPHKEPRGLGGELLMGVIVEGDVRRVPAAWLDGRRLFQLAESPHKAAREVALTLIRRLYDRVGGAERLAWLMDSPERDVRLFAVRLFWDRHRPKPWPADLAPRKPIGAVIGTERFTDLAALRQFARTVLFGLPPGRIGERDPIVEGAPKPERALPASVAKRRLIEALRDVALEDVELARAVAPVLQEMSESLAKGEWQASVQALTSLRAHHAEAL